MDGEFGVSQMQTTTFRVDRQRGPTVQHKGPYPISGIDRDGRQYEKKNVYMYNWVISLYSRNWRNIVNQQCFNLKNKQGVQPLWKTVWRFLRKLNIELPYALATPLLGTYPDKTTIQKDTGTLHPQHHYSQQPRQGNNLNVHRQMNGLRRTGTYTQWNTNQPHDRMK